MSADRIPREARAAIAASGRLPDAELALAAVAIQFARIDRPDLDPGAGNQELSAIVRAARARAEEAGPAALAEPRQRAALLAAVLHGRFGFTGDREAYGDPDNANLLAVLRRRRGLPVALGILWIETATSLGWEAFGLDAPGHFLVGLPGERGVIALDAFAGGKPVESDAPRMSRRAVLLRLQNNIRLRRQAAGDLPGALAAIEDMLLLAPSAAALWLEAAQLNERLDRIGAAVACLRRSVELLPPGPEADAARAALGAWRSRLN